MIDSELDNIREESQEWGLGEMDELDEIDSIDKLLLIESYLMSELSFMLTFTLIQDEKILIILEPRFNIEFQNGFQT